MERYEVREDQCGAKVLSSVLFSSLLPVDRASFYTSSLVSDQGRTPIDPTFLLVASARMKNIVALNAATHYQ